MWKLIKAGEWPTGATSDLVYGFVTNTAATRQYDGTTVIYGDSQPKIYYYEYVK